MSRAGPGFSLDFVKVLEIKTFHYWNIQNYLLIMNYFFKLMFLSMCLQWKLYFIVLNGPLKINENKYNYKIKEIKFCLNK
jgi:hypothetical protein